MSSFVVSTDHIDYLVSAVLAYAPERLVRRTPHELAYRMLAENIATCTFRELGRDGAWVTFEDDELDEDELEEIEEDRAALDAMLEAYRFRPVEDLDPAQAAWVAACWQYQRTRQGPHDVPETWATADAVIQRALADAPADAFTDPAGPRTMDNLVTETLRWGWSRG
ncbi:hypothetical protein [Cellulomonas gilvus]|uniref:Uncharacterized protein n=1 Tax=Cellulomonas gilvus (strain ATCC 13127 / NRRL B-14078) TaxID=593907 RepID=F8A4M0_CELGA|nr:hypothetical protein [Cellulomonas gilvus]AEI13268.1 hypothetical protein Celgi_2770 [Cellulomonas gilvus ATCC 13127]